MPHFGVSSRIFPKDFTQIIHKFKGYMKTSFIFTFILILFVITACAPQAAPPQTVNTETPDPMAGIAPENPLVLGDISDDPAEVIEGAQPVADYLAEQLKDYGITSGQVRVASSAEEMARLLRSGEVDLYFDSTYPATRISDETGSKIILRRWKFGVEKYNAVIFASKESGITSIDQLAGEIIVMDAPYSTSGYLLPAVHLMENGLMLNGKSNYNQPVASNEVGFVFSYDDENTLQWVLNGFASAGVVDDYRFDVAFPADVTANLVVLARTETTPRQVVVASASLGEPLIEAIKTALIGMDESEAGQTALKSFLTTKFDEFPEGIDVAMKRMREMMEIVRDIQLPE
jgi:phosphonate transport system substrate-binding protein